MNKNFNKVLIVSLFFLLIAMAATAIIFLRPSGFSAKGPVRRPEELPIIKTDPTTQKQVLEIPILFVVRSISSTAILLQKENGEENDTITYYPDKQNISVFLGNSSSSPQSSLENLKIGEKIKVQNNLNNTIYFYIVK